MKDISHHLKHVQKKVIQEIRKQPKLEKSLSTSSVSVEEPEVLEMSTYNHTKHRPEFFTTSLKKV